MKEIGPVHKQPFTEIGNFFLCKQMHPIWGEKLQPLKASHLRINPPQIRGSKTFSGERDSPVSSPFGRFKCGNISSSSTNQPNLLFQRDIVPKGERLRPYISFFFSDIYSMHHFVNHGSSPMSENAVQKVKL